MRRRRKWISRTQHLNQRGQVQRAYSVKYTFYRYTQQVQARKSGQETADNIDKFPDPRP